MTEPTRTDEMLRALWDLSNGGQYTVKHYRLRDMLDFAPTPDDVAALLDTGLVRQIPGMGGASSFAMTICPDDVRTASPFRA